jgi:predicted DNA-binding WGR domain protein
MYPEIPQALEGRGRGCDQRWSRRAASIIAAAIECGIGAVSYFMSPTTATSCTAACRADGFWRICYPEVHTRVTYRFAALNERGKSDDCEFSGEEGGSATPRSLARGETGRKATQATSAAINPRASSRHIFLSWVETYYTKKWKRVGTHGGSLVENFDQASSRDLLAEAMYRIDGKLPEFDLLLFNP